MFTRLSQLRTWSPVRWGVAAVVAVGALVLIGIPTVMLNTPLFRRMTPTRWWEYPIWIASSVLVGLIAATFVRSANQDSDGIGATASGGLLSALAVGCPVCNKVIVMLIGVSGALQIWAPLQPLLGVASLGLLWFAFARRLDGELACPVPLPLPTQSS